MTYPPNDADRGGPGEAPHSQQAEGEWDAFLQRRLIGSLQAEQDVLLKAAKGIMTVTDFIETMGVLPSELKESWDKARDTLYEAIKEYEGGKHDTDSQNQPL